MAASYFNGGINMQEVFDKISEIMGGIVEAPENEKEEVTETKQEAEEKKEETTKTEKTATKVEKPKTWFDIIFSGHVSINENKKGDE